MSTHGMNGHFEISDGTTSRDISGDCTNVVPNFALDSHDNTTYGATGHTYVGGLTDGELTVSGFFSKTSNTGTDVVFSTLVKRAGAGVAWIWGPEGGTTGLVKYSGTGVVTSYQISPPVNDLISFTATVKISGAVTRGTF